MPEGDTVWRTARQLREALTGRRLVRTDFRVPRLATTDLGGREVTDTVPRGKHLMTRLEGGLTLHSHLGMDGSWRTSATGTRPPGGPEYEVRAVLVTAERSATGFRLPVLELLRTEAESTVVGHLGPDLLGPDWDAEGARLRLLAAPERPLTEALLDQRNLAGVGNVYAAELCFMAQTSPFRPVGDLPAPLLPRLLTTAHRLLEENKNRLTRCTTGERRHGRELYVHGRRGEPCRRCGTPIATAEYGPPGRTRTTWYCPRCQPPPASP